jgi:hypothetical protein
MKTQDSRSGMFGFLRRRGVFQKGRSFIAASVALAIAALAAPAWASSTWISCTPVNTATYQSRVHVKCAASVGGISYFAASTSDWAYVARILSIGESALLGGRTLDILYDPADVSGAGIGCATVDCRLIQGIAIR